MSAEGKAGRFVVTGLGGCGVRIVERLSTMPEAQWLDMMLIDTDKDSLEACRMDDRLLAASEWRSGAGCGGDVMKGERSIARERSRLVKRLEGASMLVVAGGLGGGTATGGAKVMASIARNASIPAIFILTMPFSFESHARRKAAEDCVSELLPIADVLVCMPNDLLFSTLPPQAPAEQAFLSACDEMARTVFGLCGTLKVGNMLASDLSIFMAALHERKASCSIGVGCAASDEGLNRCHLAIGRMLESPMLGGVAKIETADSLIVNVCGGPDLEMGEMKRALETVSSFASKKASLMVGACTDPSLEGKVQVNVVAIKYEHVMEPVAPQLADTLWTSLSKSSRRASRQAPSPGSSTPLEQGVLELQSYSKGIFTGMAPTKYKDDDLDIPTFQRREVSIDKGDVGR